MEVSCWACDQINSNFPAIVSAQSIIFSRRTWSPSWMMQRPGWRLQRATRPPCWTTSRSTRWGAV